MQQIIIAVDNGVSGSIAIMKDKELFAFFKTPVRKELDYTKTKQYITRINTIVLKSKIFNCINYPASITVVIERPMVNPMRFKATTSALRSLEATLIMFEDMLLGYFYIDSKEWQKALLSKGIKGEELKKASSNISCILFPEWKDMILKHKDEDSILMAEYVRRKIYKKSEKVVTFLG